MLDAIITKAQESAKAIAAFLAPFLAMQLSHLISLTLHVDLHASPALVAQLLVSAIAGGAAWLKRNKDKLPTPKLIVDRGYGAIDALIVVFVACVILVVLFRLLGP